MAIQANTTVLLAYPCKTRAVYTYLPSGQYTPGIESKDKCYIKTRYGYEFTDRIVLKLEQGSEQLFSQ